MECALNDVHIASANMVDYPEPADGRPEGTWNVLERVK